MHATGHIRCRDTKRGKSYQITIEFSPDNDTGKRQRKYFTVNGTKKEAHMKMRALLEEYGNNTYIEENSIKTKKWVFDWLELYGKNLSPTTYQGYLYQIENYIINQPIGEIRLQDLTTADVQKWINSLSEESPISHESMSGKTVKNIYHNLSAALDKAVELDILKKNVCKAACLPRIEKYKAEVYDESEIQMLIQAAKGTDMELPILLDISLGLRRGELIALKWKHIDFKKAVVHIEDNMVEVKKSVSDNRYVTKAPKSASGKRTIPLSDSLLQFLKKAYGEYLENKLKMGNEYQDLGYVICQLDGKPYKPASMTSKFNRFLKKNNLKHIRLHDIRHSNATLMLSQGISPKIAQVRLGHSDFSTTMNIYSHVLTAMETDAANKIDDVIFKKDII